ncbi:hypothetical protein OAI94_00485 [bacterium]|nr:hypothetical protein [bacterium]
MLKFLKIFYLTISLICFSSFNIKAVAEEITIGIDFGFGFLDIGAEDTAQEIANISGSTVTASYDTGAWLGRVYGDFKVADSTYLDIGFFVTGDVEAKYTLSGATVTESYSANGLDASVLFKEGRKEGGFVKAGIHSSTVDGNANVTISGTTYAANAAASGTGFLAGAGYDYEDGGRAGVSYYSNLGGLSKADLLYIYYGFRF